MFVESVKNGVTLKSTLESRHCQFLPFFKIISSPSNTNQLVKADVERSSFYAAPRNYYTWLSHWGCCEQPLPSSGHWDCP